MAVSVSSALLLLLNMAGALLAGPRAPDQSPAVSDGADDDAEVDFFFFPFLVRYKSGRVERFMGTDTVPASVDAATGVASKDVVIDAYAGLAVRLYLPGTANVTARGHGERMPLVVFYHGGGFVTESAFSPTYQRYLNALVSKAGVIAVSVDYHLSPEHPLPAGYEDAWAVLRWVLRSVRSGGAGEPWLSRHADPARLFLVGDSAGGNIAHNMAMRAGREGLDGGVTIRGIALLDPYFWGKMPVPSETQDPAARRSLDRTWRFVCAGWYGVDDPVVNPVAMTREEWRRLGRARVLVTVAELDNLSARGRAYVEVLRASGWGGEAKLYETAGENHVYFLLKPDGEKAAKEMDAVVAFINADGVSSASRMDMRKLVTWQSEVSAGRTPEFFSSSVPAK